MGWSLSIHRSEITVEVGEDDCCRIVTSSKVAAIVKITLGSQKRAEKNQAG
jgi:hypothetical protein